MRYKRSLLGFAASMLVAGSANAGQVAQFLEVNGTNDFFITTVGTTTSLNGSSQVFFTFSNTILPANPLPGVRQGTLTLTSSSTSAGAFDGSGNNITQPGFSGSFSIIDNILNTNLLSGTFGPTAALTGPTNGNSATFADSTPLPTEVIFTSAYLNFTSATTQAFSLSLSNLTPSLNLVAGRPVTATAAGTGTFSADPLPTTQSPEPATVALLGSALIGLGVIRKKRLAPRS